MNTIKKLKKVKGDFRGFACLNFLIFLLMVKVLL